MDLDRLTALVTEAERRVDAARETLAKNAWTTGYETLASNLNTVAFEEGRCACLRQSQRVLKSAGEWDAVLTYLFRELTYSIRDTASGRTNDVVRAHADGYKDAANDLSWEG